MKCKKCGGSDIRMKSEKSQDAPRVWPSGRLLPLQSKTTMTCRGCGWQGVRQFQAGELVQVPA